MVFLALSCVVEDVSDVTLTDVDGVDEKAHDAWTNDVNTASVRMTYNIILKLNGHPVVCSGDVVVALGVGGRKRAG